MTLKKFQSFRTLDCQENEYCAEGKISNQSTGGHEVWQPLLHCPKQQRNTQAAEMLYMAQYQLNTCQFDDYIAFTYYSDVIKYLQLDSKQIKWNSILDAFFELVCCFSFPWLCKTCPYCIHLKVLLPSYYWIRIPVIFAFCFSFQKPSISFQPQINSASLQNFVLFCLIQLLS